MVQLGICYVPIGDFSADELDFEETEVLSVNKSCPLPQDQSPPPPIVDFHDETCLEERAQQSKYLDMHLKIYVLSFLLLRRGGFTRIFLY